MMTTKGMGRRSLEEKRHGGCAERKGRTLAQQERRSGRKGSQACKASSVRFPARRLAVERRDWLHRQDSNLRHRGYEPRGMTASLRCVKTGAPSFCGLRYIFNSRSMDLTRPHDISRPMIGKPPHSPLEANCSYISTVPNLDDPLSTRQHLRRYARLGASGCAAVCLEHKNKLVSQGHAPKMRIKLRLVNVFYYSLGRALRVI